MKTSQRYYTYIIGSAIGYTFIPKCNQTIKELHINGEPKVRIPLSPQCNEEEEIETFLFIIYAIAEATIN